MADTAHPVSLNVQNDQEKKLENALLTLRDILVKGTFSGDLDQGIAENKFFKEITAELEDLRQFALALSTGDLSKKLSTKGILAGSLKNLQSSLLHLSWQAKMISQGDFSQRVDFMGEFSDAFNNMVINLADNRMRLQQHENELVNLNNNLVQEIAERKRIEQTLRDTNEQLEFHVREIEKLHEILREQAIHDSLTGLFNRGYLQETLIREIHRAERETIPVSVIMMDIDKFKSVNDSFGHKAGDLMLEALGKLLIANSRGQDIACRYGGEEFVLVMPGASLETAHERAETIRNAFGNLRIKYQDAELHATLSLGIAAYPNHGSNGDELLNHADQALYQAKEAGRDRVVLYNRD